MFGNRNAGGWALALVALGLFLGLMLRDVVRKDNPPETEALSATMMPQAEEHPRNLDDLTERFERATTQCLPFMVTLHSAAPEERQHGYAGVLMSSEGYILTSARAVASAQQITVTLSNKKVLRGEIVGSDLRTDLAVIKIAAKGLKGIRQGNSEDLRLGQWVMALGNDVFERHTATAGIVSAKGRGNVWLAEVEDFVQTDARSNANHAGGALIDLHGRLVGINLAPAARFETQPASSLAIPVNMAREVMRNIIAEGKFMRGALPLQTQEVDANLSRVFQMPENSGVLITAIALDAAGTTLDLQRGDVISKWGDKQVTTQTMWREFVAATKPGTTMPVTVWRSGKEFFRAVTVQAQEQADAVSRSDDAVAGAPNANAYGLVLEPVTPTLVHELKLASPAHGVFVAEVLPASAAERAGICKGDIIEEWEGKAVTTIKELRHKMTSPTEPNILVYVRRGKQYLYCALTAAAAERAL